MTENNYFKLLRNMTTPSWNSESILMSIGEDSYFTSEIEYYKQVCIEIVRQLNFKSDINVNGTDTAIDLIGNISLLYESKKVSLVCHRVDELLFSEQRDKVIAAARNGNVVVSAFISRHEREIRQILMDEGLPIIQITSYGFAPNYRLYGDNRIACENGKLLQMTPWSYDGLPDRRLTREMCLVMNHLVRTVCKMPDDWWK